MGSPEFIIPCYVVVDASRSMTARDDRILHELIAAIVDELSNHPIHSEQIRFSLMQFADSLQVVLPLCELSARVYIPGITLGGRTSLGVALLTLRSHIIADVRLLQAEGYTVCRPRVLLPSDGAFCDDWRHAHNELTDFDPLDGSGFPWYPTITPVGVGADADEEALQELVHPPLLSRRLMIADESDLTSALAHITDSISLSALPSWNPPEIVYRASAIDDEFV